MKDKQKQSDRFDANSKEKIKEKGSRGDDPEPSTSSEDSGEVIKPGGNTEKNPKKAKN